MANPPENMKKEVARALPLPPYAGYVSDMPEIGEELNAALCDAAKRGDTKIIKEMLEGNNIGANALLVEDPSLQDPNGRRRGTTLLKMAIGRRRIQLIGFLLKQPGVDISSDDVTYGETPLDDAFGSARNRVPRGLGNNVPAFERDEVILALVRAGARFDPLRRYGGSPGLYWAWHFYEDEEDATIGQLVRLGADLNDSLAAFSYRRASEASYSHGTPGESDINRQITWSRACRAESRWYGLLIRHLCFFKLQHSQADIYQGIGARIASFLIEASPMPPYHRPSVPILQGWRMMDRRLAPLTVPPVLTLAPPVAVDLKEDVENRNESVRVHCDLTQRPLTSDEARQSPRTSATNSGNVVAFSFAGSSPSTSSSSTASSLNAVSQEGNSNAGGLTSNTPPIPPQRSTRTRDVWAARFPGSGKN